MRNTDPFRALWGDVIAAEGFTMLPKALITRFRDLGLDHKDLALIQGLIFHWWMSDQPPFPSLDRLVLLSGLSKATVCRKLDKLEEFELISSRPRGQRTERSLAGLVDKLETLILSQRETDSTPDMSQGETRSKRSKETQETDLTPHCVNKTSSSRANRRKDTNDSVAAFARAYGRRA